MWDRFAGGNTASVVHGAHSARFTTPVAEVLVAEMLAEPDVAYLRARSFLPAVRAWAMAEAQVLLYETWMLALPEAERYTAVGAQSPPIDTWGRLSKHAAGLRKPLGLDPVSRARIGQSLASQAVDIAALAAEMYAGQ